MKTISAGHFKARCLALLDGVAQTNEPIIVTNYGRPIAKLAPLDQKKDINQKPLKGSVTFFEDLISPTDEKWDVEKIW